MTNCHSAVLVAQAHLGNVAGTDFCLLRLLREIYHTVLARTRAWLNYLSVMKNNSIMFIHAKDKEKVKREIKCRVAAELHYLRERNSVLKQKKTKTTLSLLVEWELSGLSQLVL